MNTVIGFLNSLIKAVGNTLQSAGSLLPDSPFEKITQLTVDNTLLAGLAWIIPIPQMVTLLTYWVSAIGIYYLSMILLRWLKAIE